MLQVLGSEIKGSAAGLAQSSGHVPTDLRAYTGAAGASERKSAGQPRGAQEGCHVVFFGWVLPPLSNSWIIRIIWLYIALTRTPNIDCYWVGAVPKVLGFLKGLQGCR